MMIRRKIHNVGQGAFYTESFDCHRGKTFNVVYDCGSCWDGKSKRSNYYSKKNASHPFLGIIDRYLADIQNQVDILFISHFHHDHINGVKYLLDHANRGVKLYMPWLDENMKLYFFLSNVQDEGGYGEDDGGYRDWLYRLYFGNLENIEKIEVVEEERDGNSFHKSGKPIQHPEDRCPFWLFVPVVYIDPSLKNEVDSFVKELKNEIKDIDLQNIIYNLKNIWDAIEKVLDNHKKIKKHANNLSMMLYSGPYEYYRPLFFARVISRVNVPHYDITQCGACRRRMNYCMELPACLYVGDMEQEEAYVELKKHLTGLLDYVGLLQLSHHGDENPMNRILTELYPLNAFCCYGTKNTYHHPGWSTMNDYMQLGTNVFPINEESPSGIEQRIKVCL